MKTQVQTTIGLIAWFAALFGVLQVGIASGASFDSHSICGPWGCGPPTKALIGWHGFWLILAGPPVVLLIRRLPLARLKVVGWCVLGLGLTGLVAIGIWEAVTWLPRIHPGEPSYFVQRYLFSVVTLTDLPTIPTTLSGFTLLVAWRVRGNRETKDMREGEDSTSGDNA